jgi:hypothetical protein
MRILVEGCLEMSPNLQGVLPALLAAAGGRAAVEANVPDTHGLADDLNLLGHGGQVAKG